MKILMTGATGFLGSRLLGRLLAAGHDITILKRSFSNVRRIRESLRYVRCFDLDRQALETAFRDGRYDTIVHCATNYGRQEGMQARSGMIETNLLLPLRLLELAVEYGARNFVNTDTLLDKGVSPYALSKLQFREWLRHFSGEIGATTVSLEHFYGPDDDNSKFVTHIVRALLSGVPAIPLTPGAQLRDFIYIDDVVSAFAYVLDDLSSRPRGYVEYEVGTGKTTSIRDFVMLAKRLSGNENTRLEFGAIPYRAQEPMNVQVDTSRLDAAGWRPLVSLEEGLKRTFEYERTLFR